MKKLCKSIAKLVSATSSAFGEPDDSQAASGDCPHLLFYGQAGVGKKTLVVGFLREIYGLGAEKVTAVHRVPVDTGS